MTTEILPTSDQLRTMAREMNALHEDNNIAAGVAATALSGARKAARALEAGGSLGGFKASAEREIATAVEMYEAAKTFVTPEWQDGKPPYATWDKATKSFTVRHF